MHSAAVYGVYCRRWSGGDMQGVWTNCVTTMDATALLHQGTQGLRLSAHAGGPHAHSSSDDTLVELNEGARPPDKGVTYVKPWLDQFHSVLAAKMPRCWSHRTAPADVANTRLQHCCPRDWSSACAGVHAGFWQSYSATVCSHGGRHKAPSRQYDSKQCMPTCGAQF